jgi:signal transduction histidine kinase
MAEVATGVLHNVGNVLNSVNVSVNCITELVTKSKITNLSRLTSLLPRTPEEFASFVRDNDKGKVLPSYLPQLGNYLADEFAQIARETGLLGKNIEHIKDIISRQQNYAKISGIIEPHAIVPLVEDAIELNSDAFHRHSVEVFRHFDTVPFVLVDKHKVLQILINLLQNAKHAVSSANERKITVVVEKRGDAVNVVVRDTGMGIRPENLTKVFTHGFTTRKDGHGFGLHSGANAAKEMGGQLSAASEGEGKGACFILSLPIAPLGSSAKNAHRLPKPAAPQPEIKEAVAAI